MTFLILFLLIFYYTKTTKGIKRLYFKERANIKK